MTTVIQALSAVMADVGAIGRDQVNENQHFRFRGIDQVMNAVQPALIKHGVVVVPSVLEFVTEARVSSQGKPMTGVMARVQYRWYGPEGDFIDSIVLGESADSADKASNKAMAAAMKYAVLQTLCVPTQDMEDSDRTTVEAARATKDPAVVDGLYKRIDEADTVDAARLLHGEIVAARRSNKISDDDLAQLVETLSAKGNFLKGLTT